MLISTSPVVVVISHFPPVLLLGARTSPVEVETVKILSVKRVPVTLPVSVWTYISDASQEMNLTSPVERVISNFSCAITFSRVISPVPAELMSDWRLAFSITVSPVEFCR